MRVLFLIPGSVSNQLQTFPAVAATAAQLGATIQVACPAEAAGVWKLLPAVEKVLPFSFDQGASLADWANLLGGVRDPDFQLCVNLASGWTIDLLLALTHIPTRIASGGFSATIRIPTAGAHSPAWPNQELEHWLQPIEVPLDAEAFRLSLPAKALDSATACLPAGSGPLLLLAPGGGAGDWPAVEWQALPATLQERVRDLRLVPHLEDASPTEQAALVASADVVLSSDPMTTELALLTGTPLVALGRRSDSLPQRQGVKGIGTPGSLGQLRVAEVLEALGMA